MKDLVENRNRVSLGRKFKLGCEVVRQNGIFWTSCLAVYYGSSAIAEKAFAKMDSLRKKKDLPGLNSASLNKMIWESWDWKSQGEEWTPSPEWKESVMENILRKHMPESGHIVEIGPGGGRWTEELLKRSTQLDAYDISEECLRVCGERFGESTNANFYLTSGSELPETKDQSVDGIWSFDVFVHINRPEVEGYAAEFARVMKPGAIGVLHHGTTGGQTGGWRSNMTSELFKEVLESAGLKVEDQYKSWSDNGQEFQAGLYDDAITVFSKPG